MTTETAPFYLCPACGNAEVFVGIDENGYGGPDDCDGTCGATEDGPVCNCVTTLTQTFYVKGDEEVDYDAHTGGGFDAEIGEYTEIHCAKCDALVWRDPAHPPQETT